MFFKSTRARRTTATISVFFFFFKQKTAYEIVSGDWSSDVCSSDLPRCGQIQRGERHDRNWARHQHLWLAERAAHLATLATLAGDSAAAGRATEILQAYARSYWQYPNRDNVLGPSRLFF